jgi:hypothetical protein
LVDIIFENEKYFIVKSFTEYPENSYKPIAYVLNDYKIKNNKLFYDKVNLKYIDNLDRTINSDLLILYKFDKIDFNEIAWLFYNNQTEFDIKKKLRYLVNNFYHKRNKILKKYKFNDYKTREGYIGKISNYQIESFFEEFVRYQKWNAIILSLDLHLKYIFKYLDNLELMFDDPFVLNNAYPFKLFGRLFNEVFKYKLILSKKDTYEIVMDLIFKNPKVLTKKYYESINGLFFEDNDENYINSAVIKLMFGIDGIIEKEKYENIFKNNLKMLI